MELSIIIPTYNEKENIPVLISKLFEIYKKDNILGEVIVVDDNSPDGTGEIVESLKKRYKNLKIVHRAGKFGLSSAALEGFSASQAPVICLMDADLSHPPEKIVEMYSLIKKDDVDFVIGTRYMAGGKIIGWDLRRMMMSRLATLLSIPFTSVRDPMSGFFMLKKNLIESRKIDSKGFKILLELLIKTDYKNLKEIPIVFVNREKGKSKASTKEIKLYLENLFKYLIEGRIRKFFKFAFVGFLGTILNMVALFILTELFGLHYLISAVLSFVLAVTQNFLLNKTWTFKENINHKLIQKYFKFFAVSLIALPVNLIVLYSLTEIFNIYYIISQLFGILAGLLVNYSLNKFWVFRK